MTKIIRGDKGIYAALIILLLLSFINVLTTYSDTNGVGKLMFEHAVYVVLGLLIIICFEHIDYKGKLFRLLMIGACAISVLFLGLLYSDLGIGAARAVRTLNLGFTSIQPVEFVKVFLLIYICFVCNEKLELINSSWKDFLIYLLIPIGAIGVVGLERQGLSSTVIMLGIVFLVMITTQIKKEYKLILIAAGVLLVLVFFFIGDRNITWLGRIDKLFKFELSVKDPANAIGRGGLFGTFYGDGKLKEFLANIDSDFAFSALVEEGGILLGTFIILVYAALLLRIAKIVLSTNDILGKYLVFSLGLLIIIQAMVHALVCIGIAPETGQQLPFISKGGSSLISMSVAIGIIQGVAIRNSSNNKLAS